MLTQKTIKTDIYSKASIVLRYLIVLAAVAILCSFRAGDSISFFNELNSHRKFKLQVRYDQATQDFAQVVAAAGHIWHDTLRPYNQYEIVLTDTTSRSDFKLFWASLPHRQTMMNNRVDFISIGVAQGYWYYRGMKTGVVTKVPARYLVARLWAASTEELEPLSNEQLRAMGYKRHWLTGKIWRIKY